MKVLPASIAIALAGLLALGCGGDEEDELKKRADDTQIQKVTLKELAKKDTAEIVPYLQSKSRSVRLTGINALGYKGGDAEATRLLLEVADGDDQEDAMFAIPALARQRAPGIQDIIRKFIKSPDAKRRAGAYKAIGELGDKSLYPLLDQAVDDPNPRVRKAAEGTKRFYKIK